VTNKPQWGRLALCCLIIAGLFSGCASQAHLPGERWITAIDSNTGKPVANLPLVYRYIKKPYFIMGQELDSDPPYVTGSDGRALVPSGEFMSPKFESGWLVDGNKNTPWAFGKPGFTRDVLYVKRGGLTAPWNQSP